MNKNGSPTPATSTPPIAVASAPATNAPATKPTQKKRKPKKTKITPSPPSPPPALNLVPATPPPPPANPVITPTDTATPKTKWWSKIPKWVKVAVSVIAAIVTLISVGMTIGKLTYGNRVPPPQINVEAASPGPAKKMDKAKPASDDEAKLGIVTNPAREFFEGVLVCPANEWSKVVYIRESLRWNFPLGVPYVYMTDENGQEIPCDGIENPNISGDRINSIKFKYRVKKTLIITQVPFKKT